MCYVASQLGCSKKQAQGLGDAHEDFENNNPQDKAMDLHNNAVGVSLGQWPNSIATCMELCMQAADDGALTWYQ